MRETTRRVLVAFGTRPTYIAAAAALLIAAAGAVFALRARKPEPAAVVAGLMSPSTLVASGGRLYLSAFVGEGKSLRAIFAVDPAGGAPARLAAAPMELPALAVDAGHVYYNVYAEGSVMRVPIAGGAATPIARDQRHPVGVVRAPDALYFSARVLGGRSIFRLGLDGGAPAPIFSGLNEVGAMAAGKDAVYAVSADRIVRIAGAGATSLAPGAGRIGALAVSGDHALIAVGGATPAVLRVPTAGGPAVQLFTLPALATALAADATHVYVATGDHEATVLAAPIAGGEPDVLASDPERPSSIAVDGGFVYWASGERDGKVLRVAKPRAARAAGT